MSERAAYYTLLGLVYDILPEDAVEQYLSSRFGKGANSVTLQNVRRGTTAKLAVLLNMVAVCLPEFPVPSEVKSHL